MKRSTLVAVFAAVAACSKPSTTLSHPLFWSIEKEGNITYLLGTMHVGVDAQSMLPPSVWHRLDTAPAFAMETDADDPAMAALAVPVTGSLHAELGEAYWKKLETQLTPAKAAELDHARPMIAATMLLLKDMPKTEAMDGALVAAAQRAKKPIVYLEPAAKQLALLDKWLDAREIKSLLDHTAETVANEQEMLAAYLAGDAPRMLALAADERATAKASGYTDAEYDQEMADLLYERNASWIDAIEQLHTRGGAFIAVGALHLIGDRSVLDLLAHRGYVVTRLEP
jgi:hypothetical protein